MSKIEPAKPRTIGPPTETGAPSGPGSPVRTFRMPQAVNEEKLDLRHALRTFHFTGEIKVTDLDAMDRRPLCPAVLTPWLDPDLERDGYPLYLPPHDLADEKPRPLTTLLRTTIDALELQGQDMKALHDQVGPLARATGPILETNNSSGAIREVLKEAFAFFMADDEDNADALQPASSPLALLEQALPEEGILLGLNDHTHVALYADAVGRRRRSAREAVCVEVRALLVQLEDLLEIKRHHTPEGASPEELAAAMGSVASEYVDAQAFAKTLPPHRGARHLEPGHQQRLTETADILRAFVENPGPDADFIILSSKPLPDTLPVPPHATRCEEDPFEAAMRLSDELADEVVPLAKALRVARLETKNQYEPELHDEVFDYMDRESLDAEELALVQGVVVLEECPTLEGPALASFSHLLLSSRPVHVLVRSDAAGYTQKDNGVQGHRAGSSLPFRSVAHGDAYVLQATLGRPEHLINGLAQMVCTCRTGVAFVGGHPWKESNARAWLQTVAQHLGRCCPCFTYSPDAGDSWATSIALSNNPQPGEDWPTHIMPYQDVDDDEQSMALKITFAEWAALTPACHDAFCVIPLSAWEDDQLELSEYLVKMASETPKELPFIWVVDDDGVLQRAVLTREMVLACQDCMHAWKILQELGGIRNEYARRAADRARMEAEKEWGATREDLETSHAAEAEKIRSETMANTVSRLVAGLLGMESAPAVAAPPPRTAPEERESVSESTAPVVPQPQAETKPEPGTVESDTGPAEDPYIDTALCTTCNECTNLNPRLFKYDENKQAYIADPGAGTFKDLVKAAELCPARCIHPGTPLDGDKTATPKLIAQAAEYN